MILTEEFSKNVLEGKKVSAKVMSLKLEVEGVTLSVVSSYSRMRSRGEGEEGKRQRGDSGGRWKSGSRVWSCDWGRVIG